MGLELCRQAPALGTHAALTSLTHSRRAWPASGVLLPLSRVTPVQPVARPGGINFLTKAAAWPVTPALQVISLALFSGGGGFSGSFWSPWGRWPNGGTRSVSQVSCVSTNGTLPSVAWHVPLSQPPHGLPGRLLGTWPGSVHASSKSLPEPRERYHPTSSQTNTHTQQLPWLGGEGAEPQGQPRYAQPTPAFLRASWRARGVGHIHTPRVSRPPGAC